MNSIIFENVKDWSLLCLMIVICVLLAPIIIPLSLIDDCKEEENYYKRYF